MGRHALLSKCERLYASSLTRRHYRGGRQLSRASCSQGECTARELAAVGPASSVQQRCRGDVVALETGIDAAFHVRGRDASADEVRAGAEDVVRVLRMLDVIWVGLGWVGGWVAWCEAVVRDCDYAARAERETRSHRAMLGLVFAGEWEVEDGIPGGLTFRRLGIGLSKNNAQLVL